MNISTMIFFWVLWLVLAFFVGQHKNFSLGTSLGFAFLLGPIGCSSCCV